MCIKFNKTYGGRGTIVSPWAEKRRHQIAFVQSDEKMQRRIGFMKQVSLKLAPDRCQCVCVCVGGGGGGGGIVQQVGGYSKVLGPLCPSCFMYMKII